MVILSPQLTCNICPKRIATHDRRVKCSLCLLSTHSKCLPNYNTNDIEYATDINNHWTCPTCLISFFPYNNIEDNTIFQDSISKPCNIHIDPDSLSDLIYNPFEDNNEDFEGAMDDIDPDKNYLNEVGGRIIHNCKYHYMDSQHDPYGEKIGNIKLSLMHLNIRSIPKNLNNFTSLLDTSNINYNLLAFTETWLHDSNAEAFGIKGFNHEFITRNNKNGGGSPFL
jgi:hypothetical protein